jgi:hypothetical protein
MVWQALAIPYWNPWITFEIRPWLKEASGATQAQAVHDYHNAFDPSSLSFSKGEVITVLEQNPDGHWKGFCSRDGQLTKTGFFPSAYVVLLCEKFDEEPEQKEIHYNKSQTFAPNVDTDQPAYLQHGVPSRPLGSPHHFAASGQPQQISCLEHRETSNSTPSPDSQDAATSNHNFMPVHSQTYSTLHPHGLTQNLVAGSPVKDSSGSSRNSTVSVDSGRSSAFKAGSGSKHGGGGSGLSSSSGASSGIGSMHNGAIASATGGNVHVGAPLTSLPLGHRLSYESSASSSRHSYHSSSSSLGSLDKLLEDSDSTLNVLDMFQKGCSDQEVLAAWLSELRFEEYINNFIHAGYDMPTITRMTPEDLTAIGVTKPGHRKRLKAEISRLNIGDGIPDYKPSDLIEWLTLLRLEGYYESLSQQGYSTVDDMLQLTWEDLEDIGVSRLGHQKKLMLAIKYLQNPALKKSGGSGMTSSLDRDKHCLGVIHGHQHLTIPQSSSNRHSACSNSSNYSQDQIDNRGPLNFPDEIAFNVPPSEIVHLRQGHAPPEVVQPDIVAIQVRNSGGSFRLSQLSSSSDTGLMTDPHQVTHQTFQSPVRRPSSAEQNISEEMYSSRLYREGSDREMTPTTEDSLYRSIGEGPPRTLSPSGSIGSNGSGRGGTGVKVAPIRPRPVAKIVARTKQSIHGEDGIDVAAVPDFATLPRNLKGGLKD